MCESRSRVASLFVRKSELPYARPVSESDQLRTTNSLPFIMQEMDAKRSTKLPQRESTEENDRADTLSDACQVGDCCSTRFRTHRAVGIERLGAELARMY